MSTTPTTKTIPIISIHVAERIRKEPDRIEELADDIRERGLINPITVMEASKDMYILIAGLRRLKATMRLCEHRIRATVLSPMDADELLAMEFAENEQRQDFTVSERLAFAEKIKAVEQAKAKERMSLYAREHNGQGVDRSPHPEKGKTRDIIADRVGIGSGRQLDRALTVAEMRPDLIEKVDRGEITITGAYREAVNSDDEFEPNSDDEFVADIPAAKQPFILDPDVAMDSMRRRIMQLYNENTHLRRENLALRTRLGLSENDLITE